MLLSHGTSQVRAAAFYWKRNLSFLSLLKSDFLPAPLVFNGSFASKKCRTWPQVSYIMRYYTLVKVNDSTRFIALFHKGTEIYLQLSAQWEFIKDAKSHWNVCFLFEQMIPYMSQPSLPVARTRHRHQGYPAGFWQLYCSSWQCFWYYSTVCSSNLSQKISGSWNIKDPPKCSSQERDFIVFADVKLLFFPFLLPFSLNSAKIWRG